MKYAGGHHGEIRFFDFIFCGSWWKFKKVNDRHVPFCPQYSSKSKRGVTCGSGKNMCDGVQFGILCWDIMFCTGR